LENEHKVEGSLKLFALRCVHDFLFSACYVLSVCYFKGLNLAVLYTVMVPYSCINSNLLRKSVCKSSEAVNQIWKLWRQFCNILSRKHLRFLKIKSQGMCFHVIAVIN
jgi:hypothetical protein